MLRHCAKTRSDSCIQGSGNLSATSGAPLAAPPLPRTGELQETKCPRLPRTAGSLDRFSAETEKAAGLRANKTIRRANFKSIGSLVLITCFFVRQNRFGALIQTFSQKTAKNQISGRFPPLPSTRDVLDILLFTSA